MKRTVGQKVNTRTAKQRFKPEEKVQHMTLLWA
jgi:hypothetical protein